MQDLAHYFGNDISVSATGDLLGIDGSVKTQQRLLRRLLTNPGDLLFHPDYGAGLGKWVGKTLDVAAVTALVRGQVLMESAVQQQPEPVVAVTEIANGLACSVKYVDALSGQTQVLSFEVAI